MNVKHVNCNVIAQTNQLMNYKKAQNWLIENSNYYSEPIKLALDCASYFKSFDSDGKFPSWMLVLAKRLKNV